MTGVVAALAGLAVLAGAAALRIRPTPHSEHGHGRTAPRWRPASGFGARFAARREERRLVAELPALLEEMARALRSGASMRVSLRTATPVTTGPLRSDLDRVVARLEHGVPLHEAVDDWAELRRGVRLVQVVAAAVLLAARVGGSMAQAIDGVADTIRTELALEAEVRSLSSQAHASAVLVASLPVAFASMAGLLDARAVTFLFGSAVGLACLAGGTTLNVAGFVWMRRITRGIS